jgi:hypothetical protein
MLALIEVNDFVFVNIGLDVINMGNVLEISVNSQFVLNFKAPIVPIMAGTVYLMSIFSITTSRYQRHIIA